MLSFSIHKTLHKSRTRDERKLVPRSDNRASGTPNMGMICSANSCAPLTAFGSGMVKTNGHLLRKSWKTHACLLRSQSEVDPSRPYQ